MTTAINYGPLSQPGPDADAAVARVMGWPEWEAEAAYLMRLGVIGQPPHRSLPTFTVDDEDGFAAMREMVEWLRARCDRIEIGWDGSWHAETVYFDDPKSNRCAVAPYLPLAVARLVWLVGQQQEKVSG